MRKTYIGSVLLALGLLLLGARYGVSAMQKSGKNAFRETEENPVRNTRAGAVVLALGLILLGAWYVLGTGAANVDSRGQRARLVPTHQAEQQRPTPLSTSLPPTLPAATATQVAPTPTASRTQLAAPAVSIPRRSKVARADTPTATPRPTDMPHPTSTLRPTRTPQPVNTPRPVNTPQPTNTPQPVNTPVPGIGAALGSATDPLRFVIDTPAIQVDAPVEYVGLTADRAMQAPEGWWNVGWYELGPKPGEQGNAVIAGHLDSESGPAVFWQLNKIRIGDEVRVVDVQGSTIRFRVREMQVYYNDDAPLTKIFGSSEGAHLNLITCDGFFDRNAGIYDRRLVVFTDRVD